MNNPQTHEFFEPLNTERGRGTIALASVLMFLATVGVICRFVSRKFTGLPKGWDDYLLVISLFFYYTAGIQTCIQIGIYGQALHVTQIPEEDLVKIVEVSFFNQLSYAFTMASVKCSLHVLFRRIFVSPKFRRIVLGVMIFNGLWFIFNILAVVLRCIPVDKTWNPAITSGHCVDQLPIVLAVSVWSLVISVMTWSLPIPMVWRLHTRLRRKIGLTLLFALGIFDIAAGIARVITISDVNFNDPTYSEIPALQWLLVEPCVAILCASLPTCRPLIESVFTEGTFERIRSLMTFTRRSESRDQSQHPNGTPKSSERHAHWLQLRPVRDPDASLLKSDTMKNTTQLSLLGATDSVNGHGVNGLNSRLCEGSQITEHTTSVDDDG